MDNKIILVVDDSAFMRNFIKNSIVPKFPNATIIEADSGEKALDKYYEFNPDVTLLDVTLPGISGIDTLKEIRKDYKSKVIMCSAMGQRTFIVESIQLGAFDFIVKPFKADILVSSIEKALDAK